MVVVVKQVLCYCFAQSVVPELSVNFSQFVPEFLSAVRCQTSGEFANILSLCPVAVERKKIL